MKTAALSNKRYCAVQLYMYFPVVLFIILYKVILTFQSEDDFLKCDNSNDSYWGTTEQYFPVVLFITLYKVILTFRDSGWDPTVWPFKWKLFSSTFRWYCSFFFFTMATIGSVKLSMCNRYLWRLKKMKSRWLWKVTHCLPWNCGSWGKRATNRRATEWPSRVLKLLRITSGRWLVIRPWF